MFGAALFFILVLCSIERTNCMPSKNIVTPVNGKISKSDSESKLQKETLLATHEARSNDNQERKEKKSESERESIRKNFGEKAQTIDMQDMVTLIALYKSYDLKSTDEFIEKEVKSYVSSGRWRWQYPDPNCCVIL